MVHAIHLARGMNELFVETGTLHRCRAVRPLNASLWNCIKDSVDTLSQCIKRVFPKFGEIQPAALVTIRAWYYLVICLWRATHVASVSQQLTDARSWDKFASLLTPKQTLVEFITELCSVIRARTLWGLSNESPQMQPRQPIVATPNGQQQTRSSADEQPSCNMVKMSQFNSEEGVAFRLGGTHTMEWQSTSSSCFVCSTTIRVGEGNNTRRGAKTHAKCSQCNKFLCVERVKHELSCYEYFHSNPFIERRSPQRKRQRAAGSGNAQDGDAMQPPQPSQRRRPSKMLAELQN